VTASLFRDQRVVVEQHVAGSAGTAAGPRAGGTRRRWPARQTTGLQRFIGVLVAVSCLVACFWYVRQVASADRDVLTGSVTSTGVVDLNFAAAGVVASVLVRVGESVRKKQLLATESAPGAVAIETADAAAVTADKEQIDAQGGTTGAAASIASDRAQLARDEARLATDEENLAQTRILAPAAGVVTAVDAQPGQAAAPAGIRDYAGAPASADPPPLFSLLPESPQVSSKAGMTGATTLPMIQLRTSGSWEVLVLVPESAASSVRTGQAVRVSVPAARLAAVSGTIEEVLATPVVTADGDMYEAVVTIASHGADPPLDGMTANISLPQKAG
jgi:multidrug efflux pump subunit AcrA (membrane-fusion protein)